MFLIRHRSHIMQPLVILLALCAVHPSVALSQSKSVSRPPNLYEVRKQLDAYVDSGAYDRDIARLLAPAHRWLEKRAPTASKPAIILDVDETALSNWPAMRVNGWYRLTEGNCD